MGLRIPGTYPRPLSGNAVRITLKLYAALSAYLPEGAKRSQIGLDVSANATVSEVIAPLRIPLEQVSLVVLNGEILLPAERASRGVADGDMLAIWPPVDGG